MPYVGVNDSLESLSRDVNMDDPSSPAMQWIETPRLLGNVVKEEQPPAAG